MSESITMPLMDNFSSVVSIMWNGRTQGADKMEMTGIGKKDSTKSFIEAVTACLTAEEVGRVDGCVRARRLAASRRRDRD